MLEQLGQLLTMLGLMFIAMTMMSGPGQTPWMPESAIAVTLVGAILIGVPYARRWRATGGDLVVVVAAFWALMAVPLLPLLFLREAPPLPLLISFIYAILLTNQSKLQGRYLYTQRILPSLEGAARDVAASVVEKAGLRPLAILVAPLPAFNAMVQGLRACVVLIDRRAARELPPGELSALVAHEAGHLKYADTILLLGMPSLAAAAAVALGNGETPAFLLIGSSLIFGLRPFLQQSLELRADRFAERLVGADAVVRMLARVHADRPAAFNRTIESGWVAAFMSHPSQDLRAARLERRRPKLPGSLHLARAARWGLLLAGVGLTILLPPPRVPAIAATILLVGMTLVASIRVRTTASKTFRIATAASGGQGLAILRWVVVLGGLAGLVTAFASAPPHYRVAVLLLGLLVWIPGAFALKVLAQRQGAPLAGQPKILRTAVVEALAAVNEGRSSDGLTSLGNAAFRHGRSPWYLTMRGLCFLHAGRSPEARTSLEDALKASPQFVLAAYLLTLRHYLAGDFVEARAAADRTVALAPDDAMGWILKGIIDQEAGDPGRAAESFDRAAALKPGDVGAHAGRAHVAMDQARPAADVEAAVLKALEAGPRSPSAILAQARWFRRSGKETEAESRYREALDQLTPGERLFVPKYESLARSWGIVK